MEFSSQEANVIYNVRGDLRIEHTSETIELLAKKKQENLNNIYSTSYIDILREDLSKKNLIVRAQEIKAIEGLYEELS